MLAWQHKDRIRRERAARSGSDATKQSTSQVLQSKQKNILPNHDLIRMPEPTGSKDDWFTSKKDQDGYEMSDGIVSGPSDPYDENVGDCQEHYGDSKGQNDFRVSFLRKLTHEKVWVPPAQRPPKQQTVIIFDWDDTLLCTSFLQRHEQAHMHPTISKHLKGIAKVVTKMLEMALQLGHTFIITNAMEGWVEFSASRWAPDLLPVLQKVKIISARSRYEGLYPREVCQWKVNAFLDVQRCLDSQVITNLNSLGDSHYEMDATHTMGNEFSTALIKTVKFKEQSTPEELFKQLTLVASKLEQIIVNARNVKICLEQKS